MKKLLPVALTLITSTAGAQSLSGVEFGLTGGWANGLSGELFVHAPNVLGPVGVKAGVSYTRASDAINDNSDLGAGPFSDYKAAGATEYGSHTAASLDATYGMGELSPGVDATIYGGARYGMFRSTEDYGATGSTTYSTNAFGIGAGVMVSYALTGNLSLVGDLGVDQYFKSNITVSGTNTDTTTIARNDALYPSIDNRFVRPGTVFKVRLGVKATY